MEKVQIKNREGKTLVLQIEMLDNSKGLAFVMHGLGGFKEQPHVQVFADSFLAHGISVVRFDAANTDGESEGNLEDATVTNYYADLEDVISWAKDQSWYQEPFYLAGHSLGGISTALFAEKFPKKVKALAPISTVVSGSLSMDAHSPEELAKWKSEGKREWESATKPGMLKRLKWSHFEDRVKYNLLENVDKLTMPVLLIVGSEDVPTPPKHQKILFDALPGEKELHIIEGSPHTFREEKHLSEVRNHFDNWLSKVL